MDLAAVPVIRANVDRREWTALVAAKELLEPKGSLEVEEVGYST
jgi:hypothetical protein